MNEAEDFWRWRLDPDAWAQFQQGMLGHLLDRLGPGARYWDVSGNKPPIVGVSERPPAGRRTYTVLTTVGMSCQRMPVIEQTGQGATSKARIELAVATTLPSNQAARIFLWLAQYPWREVSWLEYRPDDPLVPRAVVVPARSRQRGDLCSSTIRRCCSGLRCLTCLGSPWRASRSGGCG